MASSQSGGDRENAGRFTNLRGLLLPGSLIASAYAMLVAMHAPEYAWLGWFTLLPLLYAIRVLTPVRAAAAGAFWGLSFFALASVTHRLPFSPTLTSLLLLTTIPAVYAGMGSRVTRRVGFSPLLLGLGWVGVELALQPLAMHHGLLASTQGGGLFFRIVGNIAGYAVVAFLVAYVSASILSVLHGVCAWVRSSRLVRVARSLMQRSELFEDILVIGSHVGAWDARGPPRPQLCRAKA